MQAPSLSSASTVVWIPTLFIIICSATVFGSTDLIVPRNERDLTYLFPIAQDSSAPNPSGLFPVAEVSWGWAPGAGFSEETLAAVAEV